MMIQKKIEDKLKAQLETTYLKVENESDFHSVPKGSETHFKVEVVSNIFEHKRLLERHRMLNEILKEEIANIRACAMHTFTPAEWEIRKNDNNESPKCAGGPKLK